MLALLKGNMRAGEGVVRGAAFLIRIHEPAGPWLTMIACPRCGAAMEDGFLGAKNWPSGIQSFRSKHLFGLDGEPVGESDRKQIAWLATPLSRLPSPRRIVLRT